MIGKNKQNIKENTVQKVIICRTIRTRKYSYGYSIKYYGYKRL